MNFCTFGIKEFLSLRTIYYLYTKLKKYFPAGSVICVPVFNWVFLSCLFWLLYPVSSPPQTSKKKLKKT